MDSSTPLRIFLDAHFIENRINETYQLIRGLQELHPDSVHIPIAYKYFPIGRFLEENNTLVKGHHYETLKTYSSTTTGTGDNLKRNVDSRDICGLFSFSYSGTHFLLYKIDVETSVGRDSPTFWDLVYDKPAGADLIGADAVGKSFLKDVYDWERRSNVKNIWVFDHGGWYQDEGLTEAVESASWDNLTLEESFVKGMQRDTSTFFSSEKIYKSLGITWKRGILLLGPPGNGKTESLKALISSTPQKALYVKSFRSPFGPQSGVRAIFEHARESAPCILIIEDIDSMVTKEVKSFFLNELDGFVQNHGVLTIATTNHPELIDDAILNRPSRFDAKYNFALPSEPLRKQFALRWIKKARDSASEVENLFARSDDETIAGDIAKRTEGWSFAFLKELFVSFLLRYAHDKSLDETRVFTPEDIETMLFDQVVKLAAQILKPEPAPASDPS